MRDERGLTLIELLVAVTILGLIIAAVTSSLFVGLRTTDDSAGRYAESHDAQLTQVHLPPDIQSATTVVVPPPSNTSCSGVSNVLALQWTEGGTTYTAAYAQVGSELRRYFCAGGAPGELVVAHNVQSVSASAAGSSVSVTVTESLSGYQYTVSAARRAA